MPVLFPVQTLGGNKESFCTKSMWDKSNVSINSISLLSLSLFHNQRTLQSLSLLSVFFTLTPQHTIVKDTMLDGSKVDVKATGKEIYPFHNNN